MIVSGINYPSQASGVLDAGHIDVLAHVFFVVSTAALHSLHLQPSSRVGKQQAQTTSRLTLWVAMTL
jgi:hypothetical protein